MISFLTREQEAGLYKFVRVDLSNKYDMQIDIEESEIVTGLTGSDSIEEAIKIILFPAEAKVQWVENKIEDDFIKYCYDNNIRICKNINIERDVYLGKIRYKLIFTDGSKY